MSDATSTSSRRLCGFRPTGRLHLGHYFSVVLPGTRGADVLVADYHAPEAEAAATSACVAALVGLGVPRESIRQQRHVFDAALYFRLLDLAAFGVLTHMPQFKASGAGEMRTAHLLAYPVLMAHDVAGYDEVVVGEDQAAHLDYARALLRKYNRDYGADLTIPAAVPSGGKVLDLRDPARKMSKSHPEGCLFLDDPADAIRSKLRAAVADDAGLANLRSLYAHFVDAGTPPASNLELKTRLADALVAKLHAEDGR